MCSFDDIERAFYKAACQITGTDHMADHIEGKLLQFKVEKPASGYGTACNL
jgi:hypothetical protein